MSSEFLGFVCLFFDIQQVIIIHIDNIGRFLMRDFSSWLCDFVCVRVCSFNSEYSSEHPKEMYLNGA